MFQGKVLHASDILQLVEDKKPDFARIASIWHQ